MSLTNNATTIGTTLKQLQTPVLGLMLFCNGTSSGPAFEVNLRPLSAEQTNAGIPVSSESSTRSIAELRRVTGFTWDQLARLFGVTRRSLHFWASGKPLTSEHHEHLTRLLTAIRQIDRGSAVANYNALTRVHDDGTVVFTLLANEQYTRVVSILGQGAGSHEVVSPVLSAAARAARRPRPTHTLVDSDPNINVETGRVLATKTIRRSRET